MLIGAAQFWMNEPLAVEPLRLRRVPSLAAAAAFAGGIVAQRMDPAPPVVAGSAVLLFALTLLALWRAPRVALLPAVGLFAAIGCWCATMQPPVPQQSDLKSFADGLSRTVRGTVVRVRTLPPRSSNADAPLEPLQPWLQEPGTWDLDTAPASQQVDVAVSHVEYLTPDISVLQPVSGGVRLTLTGAAPPLACGDEVDIALRLRVPEVYRDPGAFSYADYLLAEGIGATATAKAATLRVLADDPAADSPRWRCQLYAAQAWAATRLQGFAASVANQHLPAPLRLSATDASLLNAMLFGDRSGVSPSVRDAFSRTGTFHLFVVSGLHVALLTGGLFWLLRRLRLPTVIALITTILLATAYTLLCGFGVPAQRALLMTSVYLIGRWLDREPIPLNALGAAALSVLVLSPRALFDAAFQMTFLVIVAIAGLALPVMQRLLRPRQRALAHLDVIALDAHLHPRLAEFRVKLRMACELTDALLGPRLQRLPIWLLRLLFAVADGLILTFAAELCMAIPMAIYFHRATLAAMPLNLIDIPLLTVLLAAAVCTFLTSLANPRAAMLPAAAAALVLHAMRSSVALGLLMMAHLHAAFGALPDLRLPTPPSWAIVAACVCIALSCWLLRARSRWLLTAGAFAALLAPAVVLLPVAPRLHNGVLEVTAIDVGQGDSLFVAGPDGHTLLVDAGGPVGRGSMVDDTGAWDVGEQVVAPYLWSRQLRRLDAVAITHAHSDHIGGMPAILRDFRPSELWLSVEPANSPGLVALLAEAATLHIPVRHLHAGDAIDFGAIHATVLAPEAWYANNGAPVNDDSLVLRLDWQRSSVLLEGDAETPSELNMFARGRLSPVTLLKVGHHGSKTSTNGFFLNAVHPREAVISVGANNTFGHPRADVLERLEAAHVQTFRTDRSGATTFLLDANGGIRSESTASK